MTEFEEFNAAAAPLKRKLTNVVAEIKADDRMTEVLRVKKALNVIEEVYHQPQTTLADLFAFEDSQQVVKAGEYYQLPPLEAAKKYLAKRGEARPLAEIAEAIRTGGASSFSEDELRLSLSRSTWEVAKVGEDVYGLLSFYPHVRRGKKRRGGGEPASGGDVAASSTEIGASNTQAPGSARRADRTDEEETA